MRQCKHCKDQFEPPQTRGGKSSFCDDDCRQDYNRAKRRTPKHRARCARNMRTMRIRKRLAAVPVRWECKQCGKVDTRKYQPKGGRPSAFCSPGCKDVYRKKYFQEQ